MKEQGYEVAQETGPSLARQLHSTFSVSAPDEKTQPLVERENVLHKPELTDIYRQNFPPLDPNWSNLMPMKTPNPPSPISSKGTILIGQKGATLVSENTNGDIAAKLQLDAESFSPLD